MSPQRNSSLKRFRMHPGGRAFLFVELTVTIGLTALILIALSIVMIRFADSGKRLRAQHQAIFAAESELDRLRAGAPPSSADDLARRFPGFSFTLDRASAPDPWTGFEQVTVIVHRQIGQRSLLACRLSAYLPTTKQRPQPENPS